MLKDTNGNTITVTYKPASGLGNNTSSRISTMADALTTYTWVYFTSGTYEKHVAAIQHYGASGNDATFTYGTQTNLPSPFPSDTYSVSGTFVLLTQASFTGTPGPFKFTYNTSGEITKMTVPQGGYFSYDYTTANFSTPRSIREISGRHMYDGSTTQDYAFLHPGSDTTKVAHTETTLVDAAGNSKVWSFNYGTGLAWLNGLSNKFETYQGAATGTPLRAVDTWWIEDTTVANPQVLYTNTTLSDGTTTTQSRTEQDLDLNGNVKAVREYPYYQGSTVPPVFRTTTTTYVTDSNYTTSRNILNRPLQVKVCNGGASPCTLISQTDIKYDTLSNGPPAGSSYPSGTPQWDYSFLLLVAVCTGRFCLGGASW